MSGIYKIRCSGNEKEYIGSTKNALNDRRLDHWTELRRGAHKNKYMQAAWDKYGESSFEWTVLFECDEVDLLREEDRMMLEYNTMAPNGFNLKEAERQTLSEDTRKRMSESKMGEKNSFWGKKHSKETIERMKEKCKQYRPSEELKDKLRKAMDITTWSDERLASYREKQKAARERRTQEQKEAIKEKSKKTREEWSEEKKEEVRKKQSEKASGRMHTEDAKKKMSDAKKGQRHTEEAKERMRIAAMKREEKKKEERKVREEAGEIVKTTYTEERKTAAREGLLRYLENRRLARELLEADDIVEPS